MLFLLSDFLLEIALNAIKMNTQQLQMSQRRFYPTDYTLTHTVDSCGEKSPLMAATQFETKFRISKPSILVLDKMVFNALVLSQGARKEIIHEKISEKHLFYIEPYLEVSIYLTVESPEVPVRITKNMFSMNPIGLNVVSSQVPSRFLSLNFLTIDEEMKPEKVKEVQEFLDCFEKQQSKGESLKSTLKYFSIIFSRFPV